MNAPRAADPLIELQLRIARKADELAGNSKIGTALNLHCWLLAEREILGAEVADSFNFGHGVETPGCDER